MMSDGFLNHYRPLWIEKLPELYLELLRQRRCLSCHLRYHRNRLRLLLGQEELKEYFPTPQSCRWLVYNYYLLNDVQILPHHKH